MKMHWSIKKRWQRAHFFFTEVAQAGACEQWAGAQEQLADLSSKGSAFFVFDLGESQDSRQRQHRGRRGQCIIEYVVLLAAVAAATYIGTALFFQRVARSSDGSSSILQSYYNGVVNQISPAAGIR